MTTRQQGWSGLGAAVLAVTLAASGRAQQPAAPPPAGGQQGGAQAAAATPPLKVLVAGENPAITLRDKQGGTALTSVNFWRVHWSPVGSGTVCYVTVNEPAPNSVRIAIHDNPKVLDYVTKELMTSLNAAFNTPAFTPVPGTITQTNDGATARTETCKAENYNVELKWTGLGDGRWSQLTPGTGANQVNMTMIFVPATNAEVVVNGKKAPGGFFTGPGFPPGFLALNETWRR